MDATMVVLRLLHIVVGVFWAGTIVFAAWLLVPAVGDAGPEGGKVVAALQRRRMMDILPVSALITIVTGFWLYFRISGGSPTFAGSRAGMALGGGGVLATIGFVIGFLVMRPAQTAVAAMASRLPTMPEGAERAAVTAEMQRLRVRAAKAGRIIAALVLLSTALMAVARYL